MSEENPTPAEIAATPPPEIVREPTHAEIAMQGLEPEAPKTPLEAPEASEGTLPPTDTPNAPPEAVKPPTDATSDTPEPRYNTQLAALMAKARESREQQVQNTQQDEQRKLVEKIELAKQLGPEAALKALGIERERVDIAKLLNPEKDEEPKSIKELKGQVAEINQYLQSLREQGEQDQQRVQQERYIQWEQNEVGEIDKFINESDEYEYVRAAKSIGSDKDIYNSKISLYNQGYSPSNNEAADLVESRIEQLLDLLAPTKKFSEYIGKRFGVQLDSKTVDSVTLTDGMKSETSQGVNLADMTDEENRVHAMAEATRAKNDLLRKLGRTVKDSQ